MMYSVGLPQRGPGDMKHSPTTYLSSVTATSPNGAYAREATAQNGMLITDMHSQHNVYLYLTCV